MNFWVVFKALERQKKKPTEPRYLRRGEGNLWCNLEDMMVTMIMAVMVAVMNHRNYRNYSISLTSQ
jgi:hypothetical protein